jgi:hypothetical protein
LPASEPKAATTTSQKMTTTHLVRLPQMKPISRLTPVGLP